MLPLDVSNSRGEGAGLDMEAFWEFIYILILIMVVILLPFAIFMYESDEEKTFCSRLANSLCLEAMTLVVVCMILFISWAFLNVAEIPVETITKSFSEQSSSTDAVAGDIGLSQNL